LNRTTNCFGFNGSGFFIVVEGKQGTSGEPVGSNTFNSNSTDPTARPDLQIQANRNLGDGSSAVCDSGPAPAPLGGVPGINPPNFDPASQMVADALNDLGCRFDFHNSNSPCTVDENNIPGFVSPDTDSQFCTGSVLSNALRFWPGDTLLTVQLRDAPKSGPSHIGNQRQLVVRVP
jgi:hypothetical protein